MARKHAEQRTGSSEKGIRPIGLGIAGLGIAGLGIAGLGIAAALAFGAKRKNIIAQQQDRRKALGPALEGDRPTPHKRPLGEPPADASVSWIPGPVGGIRIIERNRRGETPVIFIHGLGGRAEFWSDQLRALGPKLRGIALDLPGHGESDAISEIDLSVLAASIGAVIDGLGLRRCLLVAHSLGASAALIYAAQHAGRVSGLFLVDPTGDQSMQPEKQRQSLREQLSKDPMGETEFYFGQLLAGSSPEVHQLVLDALMSTSEEALLGGFFGGLEFPTGEALTKYLETGGPVFSVISDMNDLPYSLHRLCPAIELRMLFGAGHWLMLDRPDELLEIFWDFLEAV